MLSPIMNIAGRPGRLTKLAQGDAGTPRISGDGSTVVWNQAGDQGPEIMRYRDGKIDQLTSNNLGDIHATPSFDGSTVVWNRFSREDINDKQGRWQVVRWQDGQETLLTPESGGNCQDPTLSADGKTVAWLNDVTGDYRQSVAQVLRNGQVEDLSAPSDYAFAPSVSADGSRVVFAKNTSRGRDIFIQEASGAPRQLTKTPFENEDSVRVTGDGSAVFYSAIGIDGTDNIFKLDIDGGKRSIISAEPKVDETWLSASADGSTVVWTNFDRRGGEADVQIKRRDASGNTSILTEGANYHAHPHVSADGRSAVFMEVNPDNTKDNGIYLWQAL